MKVGIVIEGIGEIPAFKFLIPKINSPFNILHQAVRADLQPKAKPNQVAASAKNAITYLIRKDVKLIIILIDKEDNDSASAFAQQLESSFNKIYKNVAIKVVVKDSCIENWLIADIDALRAQPKRFIKIQSIEDLIIPNKSDSVNAQDLFNRITNKHNYDKGSDPARIARHQDPDRIASNSRSFRRFLRVLENPKYKQQSKNPILK